MSEESSTRGSKGSAGAPCSNEALKTWYSRAASMVAARDRAGRGKGALQGIALSGIQADETSSELPRFSVAHCRMGRFASSPYRLQAAWWHHQ